MITDALKFVTDRKWIVELILAGVVALAIWWFCHHLIDVGVQKERSAWMLKVTEANLEVAKQQGRAEAAEAARVKEHGELETYVRNNPLHGSLASLCHKASVSTTPQTNASHVGTSAGTVDVLQVPASDNFGEQGIDQLGLLSAAVARCDQVSGQLREWQATSIVGEK